MKQTGPSITAILVLMSSTANAAEAKKQGLPQMDMTWYGNELFWLAVSFGALYACVSLFIAPAIKGILSTRESSINDAIHEAERAKAAAESTKSNVASASQDSRAKAAELMAKAQARNSSEAADALTKLDRDLARKIDQAAVVLDEAVKKAQSGIDAAAESLAQTIAEKLLNYGAEPQVDAPKLKLAVKR